MAEGTRTAKGTRMEVASGEAKLNHPGRKAEGDNEVKVRAGAQQRRNHEQKVADRVRAKGTHLLAFLRSLEAGETDKSGHPRDGISVPTKPVPTPSKKNSQRNMGSPSGKNGSNTARVGRSRFSKGQTEPESNKDSTPLSQHLHNTSKHLRAKSYSTLGPIGDEHQEFELTWCMLHGLSHMLEDLSKKREKLLEPRHFKKTITHRFDTKGQQERFGNWPSRVGSFEFKDYAPRVFQEIRRLAGIDAKQYTESICHNNYIEFISNSKSGAFFFFSNDGRFMIKTIESAEEKTLRKMLQGYYLHLKSNPDSLICRFYGLHRVRFNRPMGKRSKFHFVVMQSVFYTEKYIHAIFDLKGSYVGRFATEKDKARQPNDKMTSTVLKDQDWSNSDMIMKLGPERAEAFREQVRKDSEFLAEQAIVDYSLLLGIHYPNLPDPRNLAQQAGSERNFSLVKGTGDRVI